MWKPHRGGGGVGGGGVGGGGGGEGEGGKEGDEEEEEEEEGEDGEEEGCGFSPLSSSLHFFKFIEHCLDVRMFVQ